MVNIFTLGFIGEHGCFQGYIVVDEDKGAVRIQTLASLVVPPAKRLGVAELLTRINQDLAISTFELDVDCGTVECRTGIVLGKNDLHYETMEHLLYANWDTIDVFFPAINAVVFGGISPKQAIDRTMLQQSQLDDSDEGEQGSSCPGQLRDILGGSMN